MNMKVTTAFCPQRGANQVLTANSGSQSVTIEPHTKSVRVVNSGTNIGYVRIGEGAQTVTTADVPVLAASSVVLCKGDGENTLAYISASGTTLQVQTGEGG